LARRLLLFHCPAPPHLSTLSLHDALPISGMSLNRSTPRAGIQVGPSTQVKPLATSSRRASAASRSSMLIRSLPHAHRLCGEVSPDRKSTRLNSSHVSISYAVFCLKKKKDK